MNRTCSQSFVFFCSEVFLQIVLTVTFSGVFAWFHYVRIQSWCSNTGNSLHFQKGYNSWGNSFYLIILVLKVYMVQILSEQIHGEKMSIKWLSTNLMDFLTYKLLKVNIFFWGIATVCLSYYYILVSVVLTGNQTLNYTDIFWTQYSCPYVWLFFPFFPFLLGISLNPTGFSKLCNLPKCSPPLTLLLQGYFANPIFIWLLNNCLSHCFLNNSPFSFSLIYSSIQDPFSFSDE